MHTSLIDKIAVYIIECLSVAIQQKNAVSSYFPGILGDDSGVSANLLD